MVFEYKHNGRVQFLIFDLISNIGSSMDMHGMKINNVIVSHSSV